jgi:heterodisulfide reductase subunit A
VPLKYCIDPEACIYLTKGKCGACEKFCPTGAINFQDQEKTLHLRVGSVILAPGFVSYDPGSCDLYGYGHYKDVVTSLQFERILSATGPSTGHLVRPSDMKGQVQPARIAWIQCVGSRDVNRSGNGYCSSVCCMYAVKQSIIAKEHAKDPLDCTIFYMDMRTQGKDFDRYLQQAKDKGVRFVRSRPHSVEAATDSEDLLIRYVDQQGQLTSETFQIVVLSTGLEVSQEVREMAGRLGVALDENGFAKTSCFTPVNTSRPGIYACGAFSGPKDIPVSVMEASAASDAATQQLAPARHSEVKQTQPPKEIDVLKQSPRIGVFVCHCGVNIGGVVDVPEVAEYARSLPGVVYVEENLFTCSQDTQDKMTQIIKDKNLNRVVVAACSPRTHEGLFQETLINAGLNGFLLEMANIRNHDSWVHGDNPEAATNKAKDLVRIAVAKAGLLSPLHYSELPMNQDALVVGGGVAGMSSALSLAKQGVSVHLVERGVSLGGQARHLLHTSTGEDVSAAVEDLISQVMAAEKIYVYLESELDEVQGFVGNFTTTIAQQDKQHQIEHGVAIIATGAREHKPKEYLYSQHQAVVTSLEMDQLIKENDPRLQGETSIVFIQCVESRDENRPYCSKVCCTHSIQSALECKARSPEMDITILYRDIRTYGHREHLFRQAREAGIRFIHYEPESKPVVSEDGQAILVRFDDPVLGRPMEIRADILCLATGIESYQDEHLARLLKVPMDGDGWFLEAHQKLRPVDFSNDGVFVCGLAHYPKPIEESVAQAQAAVSRALTFLSRKTIEVGGVVAQISPELCSGCQGCLNVCPFEAIAFREDLKVAEINQALCKGCGGCAAACPSEAITLKGFNNEQFYAQIQNALVA